LARAHLYAHVQLVVVDLEEPRNLRLTIGWPASGAMRHPAYQLRRIYLPRTPVYRRAARYGYQILNRTFICASQLPGYRDATLVHGAKGRSVVGHEELAIAIIALVAWGLREQIQVAPRRSRGEA
jgi:hypothetical protein